MNITFVPHELPIQKLYCFYTIEIVHKGQSILYQNNYNNMVLYCFSYTYYFEIFNQSYILPEAILLLDYRYSYREWPKTTVTTCQMDYQCYLLGR